jgi:hypothetical protein
VIALGTPITYTHRAAVARLKRGKWELPVKGNGEVPRIVEHGGGLIFVSLFDTPIKNIPVTHLPQEQVKTRRPVSEERWEKRNKSIVTWPSEGSAIVIGLEVKQVGESHEGGGGTNMFGESDYEQGWFTSYGNVDLYVVRWDLRSKAFGHVPLWAATPMVVPGVERLAQGLVVKPS